MLLVPFILSGGNMRRISTPNTEHLYEVEVADIKSPFGETFKIEVEANTRSQAASIAKKVGYVVQSVNMVG